MNDLEVQIERFVNRKLSPPEFFNAMLAADVFVVSESSDAGDFNSIAKVANNTNVPMLPVFSSKARCENFSTDTHPHRFSVSFQDLIQHLPNHAGVVINVDHESVAIGPEGIARMKNSVGTVEVPAGMAQLFAEDDQPKKPWWKFW